MFSFDAFGPELFAESSLVIGNKPISGFQNSRSGAVVLFQADYLGISKVYVKLLNVLDSCATPTVNGLIVVTDNH